MAGNPTATIPATIGRRPPSAAGANRGDGPTATWPIPRPIALKNESIEVIRHYAPGAVIGPLVHGTRKGTVAHVKPPFAGATEQAVVTTPSLIVFPRWQKGVALSLDALSKSDGFMMVAMNAFNYELLGEAGFNTVSNIVRRSKCFRLLYSDLDEAIAAIDDLAKKHVA